MRGLSLLLFITVVSDATTDLSVTAASLPPELGVSAAPAVTSPVASRYIPEEYGHPGIALARSAEEPAAPSAEDGESSHHHGGGFKIVQWEWSYVQTPYIIASWLLVASVAKILFHLSQRFTTAVPESCMLILLGLVLGAVVLIASKKQPYQLDPGLFFLFLLPTIVGDAGYFMPARLFFDNLGAILMYAVVGTLWNAFCTGFCLYGVKMAGVIDEKVNAGLMDFLLFGALISAVDPVAVIAVFEEVHVNETLFIIVFGESLVNDAVTVVLYKVYISFVEVGPGNPMYLLNMSFAGVVGQTWFLNWFRLVPLDKIDQVVMSYGGLRGAVAFALVVLLDKEQVKAKDYFVATTIVVVFFTVMFQGLTIKPLVKWLKVPRSTNRKPTINEEIHERAFDHILTAVEDIAGLNGYHHWRDKWEQFDKNYLSKLLLRKSVYHKSELWEAYQKINIRDAISVIDQGGNVLTSARLSLPSMASRTSFPEVTNVTNYLRENGSGVCLDLQVIDTVPGAKIEEELETHHVLAGNLYKPRRRYQSHYSRHFMTVGEKERQDREVFQRNMRNRLESFKSTRYKRHKKDRSQKKRKGSDAKEQDTNDKPRRNVSWQDKDPAVVPVVSEEDKHDPSEPDKDDDVGITFVARKAPETPKERPKSVPAALDVCQSPVAAPPSPTCGEKNLPWKSGMGSLPPCVSVEATKIIPIDLQQAWNQSISSLESLASPPAPPEPQHPRVSTLSRLGGPLRTPAKGKSSGSAGSGSNTGSPSSGQFKFPTGKEEEEEGALSQQQQEMQPLMSSLRPPPPPPPPPAAQSAGKRRNPCVYLRSLVTVPPSGAEPQSRRPTQL
ncbi:sodium/hydrogen exchanger 5 [Sinocyclocheilus grahami]|uniref:Sodium/hydrogen exchanger n=1 Tax=Sinocyclocheilus grahami TaxID=75366 RepID=A0A672L5Q7_SINGR|nr:PREDICTED: sodium/hydrogen exchanger 5-like [Sinocyclocheilus grahami]